MQSINHGWVRIKQRSKTKMSDKDMAHASYEIADVIERVIDHAWPEADRIQTIAAGLRECLTADEFRLLSERMR
jgi:hypothetical protein